MLGDGHVLCLPMDDDHIFFTLPLSLQRRIDKAFDSFACGNLEGSRIPPQVGPEKESTANGFDLGDTIEESQQGGFLLEGDEPRTVQGLDHTTKILLSSIPRALLLLDIPPDDPEILAVFRNAASGWSRRGSVGEEAVSRQDWRAVCAVLLEGEEDEGEKTGGESEQSQGFRDTEDEYEGGYEASVGDDDEYIDLPKSKSKGKQKMRQPVSSPGILSSDHSSPRPLTALQKRECRKVYGLFFPGVLDGELDGKKIMIKDITRVANELKEKIQAEEVSVVL
jgi:hypothetical protein